MGKEYFHLKSIKTKVLCFVAVALLATSLTIGFVSYNITHKIMHENADEILKSVAAERATHVNSIFDTVENAVHIVSVYAATSLPSPDRLDDDAYLSSYLQRVENLFTNVATVTDGTVCYYFRLAPELTTPTEGFFFNKDMINGNFFKVPTTDLSIYDPADTEHVGWYYSAVNAGKAVWMEPYYNANNGINMISYVTPVYCNNVLIGVAGIDITFDFLRSSVESISVYENGFAYLESSNGALIYSPNSLAENEEKTSHPFTEATEVLSNGMKLTVRVEYQDIQKDMRVLLHSIIFVEIILATVFIAITVYFSNRIIDPLKELTNMAKDLAEGKKLPHVATNSKDEIGTLSRMFIEASEKLQDNMSYIKALAYRDSLTGVKNTAAYTEAVTELERQMISDSPQFAVLVADVNNLKQVNDTYGHDAGNQLIIHASRLLGGTFRYSPLYRIGGDEFVVILSGQDLERHTELLQQLDETSRQEIISFDNASITLSLARGVAVYNPNIDETFNDVFHHADYAMYMHKQATKQSMTAKVP